MGGQVDDVRLSALINPTPKQRECFEATDKYRFVLFGGGGGGGKSRTLRWWCLRQLLRRYATTGIRDLTTGLFSIDYPTLQDRQIGKIEHEFPDWLGLTKRTEKEGLCFFVKEEFGGGRIALRNLQDPNSYKSAEFCDIAIEELTENKRDVLEDLILFRLRTPGIDRPCFLGATNPSGIGLQWVKGLWIDRKFPPELQALKHEFHFVQSLVQDNPYINAEYVRSLEALPEKKRKALLEGDWTVPEGQYFANFNESERKVPWRVVAEIMQPWHTRWIGQDWGFGHATATHWHSVCNVTPEMATLLGRDWDTPRRCVFTYREQVMSLRDEGLSEEQYAAKLQARSAGEKIAAWILSSDAFGQKTSQNTAAELLRSGAPQLPQPQKANMEPGSRVVGWRFMYGLIQRDEWFISDQCPEALAAIPSLEYDPDGDEDVLKTDHVYDDIADCFAGGTMIATERGEVPIELVKAGDMVWTRKGLRRVNHAWLKRKDASVVTATMSDGRFVTCTKDHRFYANGKFSPLDAMRYGDRIEVWSQSTFKAENTPNSRPGTIEQRSDSCTAIYGHPPTGRYCPIITSTTKTATGQTTHWTTWSQYWAENIWRCISAVARPIQRISRKSLKWPKSGIELQRAGRGTGSTLRGIPRRDPSACASNAVMISKLRKSSGFAATIANPPIAAHGRSMTSPSSARSAEAISSPIVTVALDSVRAHALTRDVYDLEVQGEHEFYANGLLAHNCLRYGLVDMLGVKGKPLSYQRAEVASEYVSNGVIVEPTELAMAMKRFDAEHRSRGARRARWSAR